MSLFHTQYLVPMSGIVKILISIVLVSMSDSSVFTIPYSIPTCPYRDTDLSDGGQVLSVLAANVSLAALRAMLSGATSLCEDSSYRYSWLTPPFSEFVWDTLLFHNYSGSNCVLDSLYVRCFVWLSFNSLGPIKSSSKKQKTMYYIVCITPT